MMSNNTLGGQRSMACIVLVAGLLQAGVCHAADKTEAFSPGGRSGAAEAPPALNLADKNTAALKSLAEERWQAVIRRDFATAYEFLTPDYRESHTLEEYIATFGTEVDWHMATVIDISYDQPGMATVAVGIDHTIMPWGDSQPIRRTTRLDETWVDIDGHWWRSPTQLKFGGPTETLSHQQ